VILAGAAPLQAGEDHVEAAGLVADEIYQVDEDREAAA
jgi:hypothetical protein